MKNYTIVQKPEIFVMGIHCRTSNAKEAGPFDIPKLWNRFYTEGVIAKIPNKVSSDVMAVYCEYEGDYTGPYSVVIGCPVLLADMAVDGMVTKTIPFSSYALFRAVGEYPASLIETWGEIWKPSDIKRTYIADFELYGDKFAANVPEVGVYVGINTLN